MNETKWCVFSQLLFWNVVLGRLLFESSQTQTHLSRLLREKNLRTKVQAETSFIYNIVRVVFSNSAEIFVTSVIYTKNSSKVFTIEDFIPSFLRSVSRLSILSLTWFYHKVCRKLVAIFYGICWISYSLAWIFGKNIRVIFLSSICIPMQLTKNASKTRLHAANKLDVRIKTISNTIKWTNQAWNENSLWNFEYFR